MISNVHIQNFQSLADVSLDLAPFTVIVGSSNSGKSAFRRAIEGVIKNASLGGRIREGAPGSIVVSLTLEADYEDPNCPPQRTVTWTKGPKTNAYDVDGLVITKPGAACPPEALAMLRLGDINTASQFDAPFLVGESSSTAAKVLGDLTNVSMLYAAIREAQRLRRETSTIAKQEEGQLSACEGRLASFDGLESEYARLVAMATLITSAADADKEFKRLSSAYTQLQGLEAIPEPEQLFDPSAPSLLEAAAVAVGEAQRLRAELATARRLEAEEGAHVATWHGLVAEIDGVQLQLRSIDVCPLCGTSIQEGALCAV